MNRLSKEEYRERLIEQDFKCKICNLKRIFCGPLYVDHCHVTGKIRGLICNTCNLGLGRFEKTGVSKFDKVYTAYLNSKVTIVGKYEKIAVTLIGGRKRANRNSYGRRIRN